MLRAKVTLFLTAFAFAEQPNSAEIRGKQRLRTILFGIWLLLRSQ
jgi:hypothetical protein